MRYFHKLYKLQQQETTGTHSLDEILGFVLIHPRSSSVLASKKGSTTYFLYAPLQRKGHLKYRNTKILKSHYIYVIIISTVALSPCSNIYLLFLKCYSHKNYNSNGSYDIIPSRLMSRPLAPSTKANSAHFLKVSFSLCLKCQ